MSFVMEAANGVSYTELWPYVPHLPCITDGGEGLYVESHKTPKKSFTSVLNV